MVARTVARLAGDTSGLASTTWHRSSTTWACPCRSSTTASECSAAALARRSSWDPPSDWCPQRYRYPGHSEPVRATVRSPDAELANPGPEDQAMATRSSERMAQLIDWPTSSAMIRSTAWSASPWKPRARPSAVRSGGSDLPNQSRSCAVMATASAGNAALLVPLRHGSRGHRM